MTMWFFGWMFWVVPLLLFAAVMRRRRWERWAMMGPRDYGPYGGWWGPWQHGWRERPAAPREAPDQQQAYIETLESRIAQLEERLDFTERLLEGRREPPK
ncbi:MAG TPA: hypothetical protein VH763_01295 [Gemmatimonadales bacterium]|jgi:hypothetical protein